MAYNWGFRKQHKFNAQRTNGFGSKLEAAVYDILKLREASGEIKDIKQQDSVDLGCGIRWKVDFSFTLVKDGQKICKNGPRRWAEAKGIEDARYRICLKLWEGGNGPGTLEIWKGNFRNPKLVKIVVPKK